MKIVFDLSSLYDNFSGIERYALNISKNYIENNPENRYFLIFKGEIYKDYNEYIDYDNIEFIVLPVRNKLFFNQITLYRKLKKLDADAYVFLAFPQPYFFRKKNIFVTIHDVGCFDCGKTMTFRSRKYFQISYKKTVKVAKKIITISEFSKSRIAMVLKCDSSKIHIVKPGISDSFSYKNDEKCINKYHLPEKYILSLSTLEPRKNLKLLISVYCEIYNENKNIPHLVLAGRKGWKFDNLFTNNDAIKDGKIIFTGFIDDEDLPSIYSNSLFFVFPSLYEGFGIPPVEALACGTKVLSSNSSSLPEVLRDYAEYFINNDANDLKKSIIKMLEDNDEQKSTRNEIFNLYNWKNEALILSDIIESNGGNHENK